METKEQYENRMLRRVAILEKRGLHLHDAIRNAGREIDAIEEELSDIREELDRISKEEG